LDLSDEQIAAFEDFERRLYAANEKLNLTRVPREECWSRHFLDSLSISPLIPQNSRLLDIGAGAGFPGAPIAIARQDVVVSLLDSSTKHTNFLSALGLDITIVLGRAEDLAHDPGHRDKYDVVTGRALAQLPIQLELSVAFAVTGGLVIPMRTENDRESAQGDFGKLGLELESEHTPRYLPVYKKKSPTPQSLPRSWAQIKKKPLV